ncbi:hypothetical protein AX17_006707 [Amanita inopinata Kibby_2008]|nr:hypothetical protein AX17_006707 [Amanita inopinata Kibby_2008]
MKSAGETAVRKTTTTPPVHLEDDGSKDNDSTQDSVPFQPSRDFHGAVPFTVTSRPTPLFSISVTDINTLSNSMASHGDGSGGEQGNYISDQRTGGSEPHLPASQPITPSRTPSGYSSQVTTTQQHSQSSSENVRAHARPGYIGPYVLPAQHMGVTHTTPPPFAYRHAYPQYPPAAPAFRYPGHSPGGTSPVQNPYPNPGTSPIYSHQVVPQSASTPPTNTGHSSPHPLYAGGPYHSLQYTSPVSSPELAYRHPSFPNSPPMYQAQYGQPSFPQHYGPSPESDQRATWWYMHGGQSVSSQQQFDGGHYQRPYPLPYAPMGSLSADPRYVSSAPAHLSPGSAPPSLSASRPVSSANKPVTSSPEPHASGVERQSHAELSERGSSEKTSDAKSLIAPERPMVRRPYHPKPPPQRSDWVMWTGNVPSDATRDELWQFFSKLPQSEAIEATNPVVSVFLITRSNCAFINFDTEAHLNQAIEHFNGVQLRPNDYTCPRLVCRVRKTDDDLRTGVGSQRGMGMHTKWIKGQKGKKSSSHVDSKPREESPRRIEMAPTLSISSSDEENKNRVHTKNSSSSGSYASTTSSILARHFPKRYFILKSLTQYDLDLSREKGLWATQKHNEGILDQAYRTSQDVYLIFGVNKSGEFYGYGRMAGPVQSGEHRVPWEARKKDSSASHVSPSSPIALASISVQPSPSDAAPFLSQPAGAEANFDESLPNAEGVESQQLIDPEVWHTQTAPAEMGAPRQRFTLQMPTRYHTSLVEEKYLPGLHLDTFKLDTEGPLRAVKTTAQEQEETARSEDSEQEESDEGANFETQGRPSEEIGSEDVAEEKQKDEDESTWGESFKVEWLCTERLPFYRTKHIRNPWNHGREVKVSRDGTELEPNVGQQLLDEWHHLAQLPGDSGGGAASTAARGGRPTRP